MHRLAVRAFALTALVALAVAPAWGASDGRKGTSGAEELIIPVGPRGTALSGTVTSDVTGIESMFWNPAGLGTVAGTEVLFTHTSYLADMKVNYAAAATKVGGLGVLGLSAKVLSIGDIIVTTEQAPDGTGQILTPTFTVLGGTWAKELTDRVRFGATLQLVNEHVAEVSANGVAMDFGVQYDTGWRGLRFGVVMKNFGPSMSFSGSGFDQAILDPDQDPSAAKRTLSYSSAPFELPSYFTLAATYDLYHYGQNRFQLLGSFQNNNFSGDTFAGGAELTYHDFLALRGSYYGTLTSATDPTTGDESMSFAAGDDAWSGYALGAGIVVPTGGNKLAIDFTWKPVRAYFNDTIETGLSLKF